MEIITERVRTYVYALIQLNQYRNYLDSQKTIFSGEDYLLNRRAIQKLGFQKQKVSIPIKSSILIVGYNKDGSKKLNACSL
jgi:hypothetical protein